MTKHNRSRIIIPLLLGGILMLCLSGCFGEKYNVDYNGQKDAFAGAKDAYRAGAKVTLYFDLIATDTDYAFYLDGERLSTDYDDQKGFILSFTMPAHDVKLTVESRNIMTIDADAERADAVLTFDSFDGGGPEFTVIIDDRYIVDYTSERVYGNPDHAEMDGSAYTERFVFIGLAPGQTTVTVQARSPIADNYDAVYAVTVDEALRVTLESVSTTDLDDPAVEEAEEPIESIEE